MTHKIEHNGKTVELPDFGSIPFGVLRKARHEKETDQAFYLLEQTLTEEQLEFIDSIPTGELTAHLRAWTGGVPLGES